MSWLTRLNWPILGPIAILVVGLALMLTSPAGFRTETLTISLQVASVALPTENSDAVALVDIDTFSAENLGVWPWPRTQIAQLILAVHEAGASSILVTLPFDGPDHAAPQRAVAAWAQTGNEAAALSAMAALPDTDQVLLGILNQTNAVLVLQRPDQTEIDAETLGALPTPLANVAFAQEQGASFAPLSQVRQTSIVSLTAPWRVPLGLRRDFAGRPSGIYPIQSVDGAIYPTAALMPVLPLLLGTDDEEIIVGTMGIPGTLGFVDPVGMTHVQIENITLPTLTDGVVLLRHNVSAPAFSASNILNGSQSDRLSGRTVIIGSSLEMSGSGENSFVPSISVAQALTAAAAQVASGSSVARPFLYTWIEVLIALFGVTMIVLLGIKNRPWIAVVLAFVLTIALFGTASFLLSYNGTLLDASAVGLLLIFAAAFTMAGSENNPQNIRKRFGHAVESKLPFGTPARLIRNPKKLLEGAESRKISVLHCTIRDFEDLQDLYKDDPEGLTNILHQFHEMVGDTVRTYGGTADRYGGATVLAFWNAPLEEPDHALKACDCGLRIIDALERLNQAIEGQAYRMGKPFSPIHLGIGINTGRSVVGNVGSPKRPDYSAVGETVTVAHSLLTASAHYGPAIVVGEHTYQAVKNRFALLEIDKINVPHRAYAIRVFALLGNPVTKASPRFRALDEAHGSIFEAYRAQNWALAEALIRECRKLNGAIPSLYDLYENRISYYRSFPPEQGWDGSFNIPVV